MEERGYQFICRQDSLGLSVAIHQGLQLMTQEMDMRFERFHVSETQLTRLREKKAEKTVHPCRHTGCGHTGPKLRLPAEQTL